MSSKGKWFADPEFWTTVRPAMFSAERHARTGREAGAIAKLLDLPSGSSILDVCCGFGRFSLAFAGMGHRVTAFDLCRPFVEELQREAKKRSYPIAAHWADITKFSNPQRFDAAVFLYASCGYFDQEEEDVKAMANVFRHVRPGGRILVDSFSVQHIHRSLVEQYTEAGFSSNKVRKINPQKTGPNSMWIDVDWITAKRNDGEWPERRKFEIRHRIYTGSGLERLLSACGFTNIKLFRNYEGDPYSDDCLCESVVALAEKSSVA